MSHETNPPPATGPTAGPTAAPAAPATTAAPPTPDRIRDAVVEVLRSCYDPEIPVNIYELGLIYDVAVSEAGAVVIQMTLTSPACPAAQSLPPEVEAKVLGVAGVSEARVDVVWEPIWNPSMMTEAARLQLGLM